MTVNRLTPLTALAVAALVTAGCGSLGLPDILGGGGDDRRTGSNVVTVRGTVEDVDTRSRLIVVDGDATYNLRNAGSGDRLTLYYDSNTTVVFEGRTYDPADLERGDRIVADVDDTGSRLVAERIEVTHDVTGGVGSVYDDDRRLAELRGTVRSIDTSARTLVLERASYTSGFTTHAPGGGDVVTVHWDAETVVEYQGRFYGPDSLERGDVVDVEVTDTGSRLVADEIAVVRDVRAGLGGS
ncbi:MAG TPA: hypothetical protein VF100_07115 [Thermoanaerobaculia bacterium]